MATDRWFFPTNINNIKAILAHGLICGPAGFKKYYIDISNDFPGFIPIFRNGRGGHINALSKAKEENNSLITCLLEINLDQIKSGDVYLLDNTPKDISICKALPEAERVDAILLPSPLPLSCIKQVIFNGSKAKKTFEGDIACYGDTPQGTLKLIVATTKFDKKLFEIPPISKGSISPQITPETAHSHTRQKTPSPIKINYKKMYSLGGLLCTLFYFAKNGSTTNTIFRECTKLEKLENADNTLYRCINNYFHDQTNDGTNDNPQFTILHRVLNILVEQEKSEHITSIINLLQSGSLFDKDQEKARSKELSKRLAAFYHSENIDSKASTLFSRSNSTVEKILLLLAHRDDVAGLVATDIAELEVFKEDDYIIAAMLFGARCKYHKIPVFLREYAEMQDYMSYLMAQYAHTTGNTGITFKKPTIPLTIMEMVAPKRREQSKKLGFIYWLSSKYTKLQNCFETIIPNKKFVNDNGKSTYDGVILPEINMKEQEYFNVMSKIKIDDKSYEAILKKYKSA